MKSTVIYTIFILAIIFLYMNIRIRDDLIWKLRVENEDLKEQIQILKGSNENEQ